MNITWKIVKQLKSPRLILPGLLSILTRHPRYLPEIKWSNNSWTHNIFRLYEKVFWRREGIRIESSVWLEKQNGKRVIRRKIYTFEAACAWLETLIRNLFEIDWLKVEVVSWQFAVPSQQLQIPMFSFAIALDYSNGGATVGASPATWSHTCTGSNLFLAELNGNMASSQPTTTAVSYNSVAMTNVKSLQNNASSLYCESSIWFLGSPASGANTVSVTYTIGSSGVCVSGSVSYTGCQSASTADATQGISGTAQGSGQSQTLTTVADNCWAIAVGANTGGGGGGSMSQNTFSQLWSIGPGGTGRSGAQHTNGVIHPAGATTITMTPGGATVWSIVSASFAPLSVTTFPRSASVAVSNSAFGLIIH
jgi:hypothetical protein